MPVSLVVPFLLDRVHQPNAVGAQCSPSGSPATADAVLVAPTILPQFLPDCRLGRRYRPGTTTSCRHCFPPRVQRRSCRNPVVQSRVHPSIVATVVPCALDSTSHRWRLATSLGLQRCMFEGSPQGKNRQQRKLSDDESSIRIDSRSEEVPPWSKIGLRRASRMKDETEKWLWIITSFIVW